MSEKMKIGILGCGNISNAYFAGAKKFDILEVKSCADIRPEAATAKAEEHKVKAVTIEEMLADPEIKIIVNLTVPKAHYEVGMRILEAGKHLYCEKPLGINREEGRKLMLKAKEKGLRAGCAPDTFLGAGMQTCRKLIDDGWIGDPIAGTAHMMGRGPAAWHPNPAFFYDIGGGPMLDLGPYYVTALIFLLGPVKSVLGHSSAAFKELTAGAENVKGMKFPVNVPTHESGIMLFHGGASINLTMSFDVMKHTHRPIEIYGTQGSIQVPDPNTFGGPSKVFTAGAADWVDVPMPFNYTENSRSLGVADMAQGIVSGRPHRCDISLASHALDVMFAFSESSDKKAMVDLSSKCDRPAPLPLGLPLGVLDK